MLVHYHYHKNKFISVCFDASERDKWPARSLRAKGMSIYNLFAQRQQTHEEIQHCKSSSRYIRYKYFSWDGLINDEIDSGASEDFIAELRLYAQSHPLPGQPDLINQEEEDRYVDKITLA